MATPKADAQKPCVVLAVAGSIAAFKAAIVVRSLLKEGVRVLPILTRSGGEFLGAATLSGLTGEPVSTEMFDGEGGERHVELARDADVIVVVPTTADLIARLSEGRADDLVTATCLCARGPIVLAPAMHPSMWAHPATRRNVDTLRERGAIFVGPVDGEVASGDRGLGRLAEPEHIVAAVLAALSPRKRDLEGRRVLISAGPTVEDIDAVRFISNRSSGKMGFALAAAAIERGADVTIITGPVSLATPAGARRIDVRSALDLQAALAKALGEDLRGADVLVMSAAVGDYRVASPSPDKLKRSAANLTLELVPNPDILADIGRARSDLRAREGDSAGPLLVGFAVETDTDAGIVDKARGKLSAKGVDLVVANHAAESLGRDDNRVTLVTKTAAAALPTMGKAALARELWDRIVPHLESPDPR